MRSFRFRCSISMPSQCSSDARTAAVQQVCVPCAPADTTSAAEAPPAEVTAEQPSQLCAKSSQAAAEQLSPDVQCLALGAIVPLLPCDSAPSSPAASAGAQACCAAPAAGSDGDCDQRTTAQVSCYVLPRTVLQSRKQPSMLAES